MAEVIGWMSSSVLVFTVGKQVHTQWRCRTSKGVSGWLFAGQITASTGFTWYSWDVGNWIFVITNSLMFVIGCLGATFSPFKVVW
jgi:MtN3 and saliva related transmembrane protein